jgi:Na+/proline symporter
VSALLLLGGCSVYDAVAGINIVGTSFVIPLLTLIYTLIGGLKATFLAGYVHTAVIMVILVIFVTSVYGIEMDCTDTSKQCVSLGSAGVMYERLTFMTSLPTRVNTTSGLHQGPATLGGEMNRQGSYLTMMSADGLAFGIINIIGNFGTVFVDQSYWQSAIAAKPGAAHKGYILGGMVWFTIPFALATALGLAGNALNVALTSTDAGKGLVPPASAIAMFGAPGGIMVMIQLTMAILSTGSAECIAVSSILSYDVYRTYFNPEASGKKILLFSRIFVCFWALVMAAASCILNEFNIGLGYVYNFMATALGSAVVPIACSIYTDKLDKVFAITAAVLGGIIAIVVWLAYAATLPGGLSYETSANLWAQLYGGLSALLASLGICIIGCLVKPMNFDWNILSENIKLVGGDGGENAKVLGDDVDGTPEALLAAKAWIFKYGWGYSIFLCILWPLACVPMGAFGKSTFQLWAGVALMWGWIASIVIIAMPLWESREGILDVIKCAKPGAPKASSAGVSSAVA